MFSLIGPVTRFAKVGIVLDSAAAFCTLLLSYVFLFIGCVQAPNMNGGSTSVSNAPIVYVFGGMGFAVLYFALSSGVTQALSALVMKLPA